MFDLSVVSLLLCAVPCREVGAVGEKNGRKGRYVRRKKSSCSGAERTEADIAELVPRFCSFLPLFWENVPFFCVFLPSFSGCFGGVRVSSGRKSVVFKKLGVN